MEEVGFGTVLTYGLGLTGMLMALVLLTGGIAWVGVLLGGDALLSGGGPSSMKAVLSFASFVIAGVLFTGGLFGIVFKVIADAVNEGMQLSGGI